MLKVQGADSAIALGLVILQSQVSIIITSYECFYIVLQLNCIKLENVVFKQ